MSDVPPHERPVNMMFQSYALFPHMTVEANVGYGIKRLPLDSASRRRRIQEALDMVQLGALGQRKPHQLSGGQRQRVALARALITRPAVVFADEPTGNLDSNASADLLTFLRRSVTELGQSVVMVTHDPRGAAYADRVIFLADGRVVGELEAPTADSVLERMRTLGT